MIAELNIHININSKVNFYHLINKFCLYTLLNHPFQKTVTRILHIVVLHLIYSKTLTSFPLINWSWLIVIQCIRLHMVGAAESTYHDLVKESQRKSTNQPSTLVYFTYFTIFKFFVWFKTENFWKMNIETLHKIWLTS